MSYLVVKVATVSRHATEAAAKRAAAKIKLDGDDLVITMEDKKDEKVKPRRHH